LQQGFLLSGKQLGCFLLSLERLPDGRLSTAAEEAELLPALLLHLARGGHNRNWGRWF
jgi:hypothetical protein